MPDKASPDDPAFPPGEAAPGLEIHLFGPLEVRLGPSPLPRLRSRKGVWLLALLALRAGRHVERGWLAGTLWPECDEAHGRLSLRQSLYDLRLALGPEAWRLKGEAPQTLRLDVEGAAIDALAFDGAIACGDLASLAAAVRLYRGRLLADCSEEWVLEERQPREQAYMAALEQLAAAATARGEASAAASYLRLAVGTDPYREELQRALMEALAEGGNPAGALIVYRQLRALLWREMTAEPVEETTALFRRLREETRARARPRAPAATAASPPDVVPPPCGHPGEAGTRLLSLGPGSAGHLPQPLSAFVGREKDLLDLGACLASARLVTLTGTGGIGKTRLAIRAAEEFAWEYADGAWFADLAALADAALVPQAVARALRVPEAPGSPLTETLLEALGARQLLLVLDNCEHLIGACARLADTLLSGCPQLRILATSRQSLGLTGEIAWPVSALSIPQEGVARRVSAIGSDSAADTLPATPDIFMQYEAIHLFVERAAAASGFALGERNALTTAQICRRLDGIPLAIELAAARLKVLSVEEIAARLDDRFRLLTGGSRAALPRQQTLQATMDWSYDLLAAPERVLLRRLSVFTGGFTLEAAEAVCADEVGSGEDSALLSSACCLLPADVLDLLTQLVERSLVGVARRDSATRYVLLETTRAYAWERLQEAGEEAQRRRRHAQYFLALAERAEPELRGAAQAQWLQRMEEEHDNCRAAIEYFMAQEAGEEGLRLGGTLGWFWWLRGYLSEGRERLQALLAHSGWQIGPPEPGQEVRVTRPEGDARHPEPRRGRFRQAQAKALNLAGMLSDDQGDHQSAERLFQESLALSRELDDQAGAGLALNNLGGLAAQARDYPAARALFEESLVLHRGVGDPWCIAASLTNLGRIALYQGDYVATRALLESGLEIQRQMQDQRAIARSLTTLGLTAARLGDYEAAHALHVESLSIVRELGAKQPIEETLGVLATIARERGDDDAALAYYDERLTIAREMGSNRGIADSLYYLALLARDRGEGSRAAAFWSECLALSERLGDPQRVGECQDGLARLAAAPVQGERGQN
jgi:predicted ATPase/DNA-binding SARP family transcriptional activator